MEKQCYPKWKYHSTLTAQMVHTPEAEEALGADWVDAPVIAGETAPAVDPKPTAPAVDPKPAKGKN